MVDRRPGDREPDRDDGGRELRVSARMVAVVVLLAVLVALAVDNRHSVRVGYLVGDRRLPLVWVIVLLLAAGALLDALVGRFLRRRRR